MPVYISTIIVTSTVSGGIYFKEIGEMSTGAAFGLAGGVLLVVLGVYVQASQASHGDAGLTHAAEIEAERSRSGLYASTDDVDMPLPLPDIRSSMHIGAAAARRPNGGGALDGPIPPMRGGTLDRPLLSSAYEPASHS